jgi:small subunit ribosomal protein S6
LAKTVYEGMFILNANRYGRDPEGVSGQLGQMVEKAGGEMLVSRLWEERRLAYPIAGQRKGIYWLTYFRLDGTSLVGIQRECDLNDNVLRVLFLKVDPRIVDTLVAHALSGRTAASPSTAGGGDAAEDKDDRPPRRRERAGVASKRRDSDDSDADGDEDD